MQANRDGRFLILVAPVNFSTFHLNSQNLSLPFNNSWNLFNLQQFFNFTNPGNNSVFTFVTDSFNKINETIAGFFNVSSFNISLPTATLAPEPTSEASTVQPESVESATDVPESRKLPFFNFGNPQSTNSSGAQSNCTCCRIHQLLPSIIQNQIEESFNKLFGTADSAVTPEPTAALRSSIPRLPLPVNFDSKWFYYPRRVQSPHWSEYFLP